MLQSLSRVRRLQFLINPQNLVVLSERDERGRGQARAPDVELGVVPPGVKKASALLETEGGLALEI